MCAGHIFEAQLTEGAPDYNLDHEFDDANYKYFGGALVRIVLKYAPMTKRLGFVKATINKNGRRLNSADIQFLAINNRYEYTYEQFLSTFLHELIHVYMLQNVSDYNWYGGYHGNEWQRMADKISSQSGVKITAISDGTDYVYDKSAVKEMIVLIAKMKSGTYGIGFTTPAIWNKNKIEWEERLQTRKNIMNTFVIKTVDPTPLKFATKFVGSPKFYEIDNKSLEDFMANTRKDVIANIKKRERA